MTIVAGRFTALAAFPPLAVVSVYTVGTTTLAALYADKITGTAAPNPVTADLFGDLSFFATPGDLTLFTQTGDAGRSVTVTVPADPTEAWPG
jgi:hypothetical protein